MDRENRLAWFHEFSQKIQGVEHKPFDLILQARLSESAGQAIRAAAKRYICSCLQFSNPGISPSVSDEGLVESLEESVDRLANRTPNGELLPKREFEVEFNEFHAAVASWLKGLSIDSLIHEIACPVAVRVVKGTSDPQVEARPYSSAKLHVDLWNGDSPDTINVLIPLFGDAQRTTIEFYQPPDDFEKRYLRMMGDYNEGQEILNRCKPYPVRFELGCAHFIDAVVPHRTVKRGGGIRVSIQFQLRRTTSPESRAYLESLCDQQRLKGYHLSPEEWYALGVKRFLKFSDTYADAQRGIFVKRPYRDAIYHIADALK